MGKITIREPKLKDQKIFLKAMQKSQKLHYPWVKMPLTVKEFNAYLKKSRQANQRSFLVLKGKNIVGVFNISEIVFGQFQSAFLGFCSVANYAGKGLMSTGLKLVLAKYFKGMKLHRLEANIQPANSRSIELVKNNGFRNEGFSPRYLKINNEWRGHEHWAITYEDYVKNDPEILKKDQIEIVKYNKNWPKKAKNEINKIKKTLSEYQIIDIQHVGSTAIPQMAAKPIIDIQIAVQSLKEMKGIAVQALQKLGYEYWDENPDPNRLFFVKGMPPYGEKRSYHVHIFPATSEHWNNRIFFRDYLRAHPQTAKQYETLKKKLSKEFIDDREKYTKAKDKFVRQILKLKTRFL